MPVEPAEVIEVVEKHGRLEDIVHRSPFGLSDRADVFETLSSLFIDRRIVCEFAVGREKQPIVRSRLTGRARNCRRSPAHHIRYVII